MLQRVQKAIYFVVTLPGDQASDKDYALGTAFAVRPDLLVTCHHVLDGASRVALLHKDKATTADILDSNTNLDLALLKPANPANLLDSFLKLSEIEELDDSVPLLVWTWPGWDAWMMNEGKESTPDLQCVGRAAVATYSWSEAEGGVSRFAFAGHVQPGMSGGPVISALTGEVVGIVTASWNLDPSEIVQNWKSMVEHFNWYDFSGKSGPAPDEIVEAQLSIGMGIAVLAKELATFVAAHQSRK